MPTLEINGVPHYIQWISESADPGHHKPVIIFVHGWGGSCSYWETTAQALVSHYDCLLYDMRGFGQTPGDPSCRDPKDPSFQMGSYALELQQVLEVLDLHQVTIVAHSMGGSVATLMASQPNPRLQRLILTCFGVFDYDPLTFGLFHQIGSWVVSIRPSWLDQIPGMERLFIARFIHKRLPKSVCQSFLQDYLRADQTTLYGTLYTSVSKEASEQMPLAFQALSVPTLLISGEKDVIIPAALGEKAAQLNSRIQYVRLPAVAHLPMLEDPDLYQTTIKEFLAY